MQGTSDRTNEVNDGLQSTKAETISLEPWDIAEKLLPIANGQRISVELASDAQFQAWIASQGVPVDDAGIAEWSFDDRCGVIMYALSCGIALQFAEAASEEPDRLLMAMELLRQKPEATDEDMRAALGLRTHGVARMWKVKARDLLAQEGA